jgi:DNA-binding transcriptional LysR family regulator
MQREEIDLAVSYDAQPLRSLRLSPIIKEDLLLIRSATKRRHSKKPVTFASLAGQELILPSHRNVLRQVIEDCASRAKIQLRTTLEVDSFAAMIELVKNGFGSTILPLAAIHSYTKRGELDATPLVNPTPTRTLVLAFPADRPVSPAARFIGDAFRRITAELVNRNIWVGKMIEEKKGPTTSVKRK